MLSAILLAGALVASTVVVHTTGFAMILRFLRKALAVPPIQPWPTAWLLIQLTWFLILIHLVEITVWGLAYLWGQCLPDMESAFYFSGVTYTTVGYGDIVLAKPWRLIGPVEGLTGILMCGLSAGLFFATLTRILTLRDR